MTASVATIDRLSSFVDQQVTLRGWIHHHRSSGKVQFVVVRDGTGLCQCVVEKGAVSDEAFDALAHAGQESSLTITGSIRADERAPGGYELAANDVAVLHQAAEYPISPKAHGIDFLMKHRHLWLRSPRQAAIMRIRSTLVGAIRGFFDSRGFALVDTPIFAPSAGEGASTLFEVDYFGEPVYLAQTGQLYLESAAMSLGQVYCFGPTFRAEKSKTRRHLTEFWMVEPEVAWTDLDGLLTLAEDFISHIVTTVLDRHERDLSETLERDIEPLRKVCAPFVRMTYTQAADLLRSDTARQHLEGQLATKNARIAQIDERLSQIETELGGSMKQWKRDKTIAEQALLREERAELAEQAGNIPGHMELAAGFEWGTDLGGSDETIISQLHDKPVFVTHYPRQAKAFYMRTDRDDDRVVENFDLLAPEGVGEIIGGSVREEELDRLEQRMAEEKLDPEHYQWYLDLRRYGSVPHGGFGLGVERTLGWLCGLKHIREAIAFPRLMGRVYP